MQPNECVTSPSNKNIWLWRKKSLQFWLVILSFLKNKEKPQTFGFPIFVWILLLVFFFPPACQDVGRGSVSQRTNRKQIQPSNLDLGSHQNPGQLVPNKRAAYPVLKENNPACCQVIWLPWDAWLHAGSIDWKLRGVFSKLRQWFTQILDCKPGWQQQVLALFLLRATLEQKSFHTAVSLDSLPWFSLRTSYMKFILNRRAQNGTGLLL